MENKVRDPIHKHILFNEFERRIIDHPFFQRLRFISQLSFLQSYVYPGGVHNRFTHSLGAMHVAGLLFTQFVEKSDLLMNKLNKDDIDALRKRIRVAGLLHDIGHGPFSNASEVIFPNLKKLPLNWSWWKKVEDRQAVHEDYSVLLIQTLAEEGLFDSGFAQDICSLIHKDIKPSEYFNNLEDSIPSFHRVLKGLISGEVDCDRMDYLLRDSYYCGVSYGHYDLEWLISAMGVAENNGKLIFTISEKGVRAFEDLLLARYHMIDQVYFHKTKAGFVHYLEQAIKNQEIKFKIPTNPKEYAKLRDGTVIDLMFEASENKHNYWSYHLMNRITAKRIIRLQRSNLEDGKLLENLIKLCEDNEIKYFTNDASGELSHLCEGMDSEMMIYVEKKNINSTSFVPIYQYSDLLQKYNEKIQFTDFFVRVEDFEKFNKNKNPLV